MDKRHFSPEAVARITEAAKVQPAPPSPVRRFTGELLEKRSAAEGGERRMPSGADVDDFQHVLRLVEFATPIDTTGPLPMTTPTLAYVPPQRWPQYVRRMDGTFRLSWIDDADSESVKAYMDAVVAGTVAAGALLIVPAGETPDTVRLVEEAKARAQEQVSKELAASDAAERARIEAAERAKLEAKHKAEMDRLFPKEKSDREMADIMKQVNEQAAKGATHFTMR